MSERVALKRGAVPKAPKRKAAKPARAPAAPRMIRLPVAPARFRRWVRHGFALLVMTAGIATVWALQIPQKIWLSAAQTVARAGLEVRHVEVTGAQHVKSREVYNAVLNGPSNSMLLIDLDEIRDRLRALPWVADASVARRLPDTINVAIVERKPVALWQYQRRLAAIDRTGKVLDTEGLGRFAKLPLIIGAGANVQAQGLMTMLADYPQVADNIDSATWIGGRRWDLRFKTGEVLALPEGYPAARRALASFIRMDQDNGLLQRGFARFDMRLPDRMIVRVSGEPGALAQPAIQAAPTLPMTGTEI